METEARRRLITTQEVLESNPQNEAAKEMVEAAKEDLNLVEEKKLRDIRTWSQMKWIRKGHAATKEFFAAIKHRAPKSPITKLVDEDGVLVSSQVEVGECCKNFYSKSYKRCTNDFESARARVLFLENLFDNILERMKRNLSKPMTKGELHEALETTAKEKAPKPNGVTIEFFLNMWNVIGRYYSEMV